jgi:hypothetical protein
MVLRINAMLIAGFDGKYGSVPSDGGKKTRRKGRRTSCTAKSVSAMLDGQRGVSQFHLTLGNTTRERMKAEMLTMAAGKSRIAGDSENTEIPVNTNSDASATYSRDGDLEDRALGDTS